MNIKKRKTIEQSKTRWLCLYVKHKCGLMLETVSRSKCHFRFHRLTDSRARRSWCQGHAQRSKEAAARETTEAWHFKSDSSFVLPGKS